MGSWIRVSLGAEGTQNLWIQVSGLGLTPLHNQHRRHCWWVFFFDVVKKASWWYPECCNLLSGTLNFRMTRTRIPNTKMGKFKAHTHTHTQSTVPYTSPWIPSGVAARTLAPPSLPMTSRPHHLLLLLLSNSFSSLVQLIQLTCTRRFLPKKKKYQKNKKKIQENTRTRTPLEPEHTDTRKGLGDGRGGGGWKQKKAARERGLRRSWRAQRWRDNRAHTKGPTSVGSWFRDGLSQGT